MSSKYDQLTQLKALFDSGALTQDEFDAAKKRILDSEDKPQAKESSPEVAQFETKAVSPTRKLPTWVIPTAIAVVVVIVVIIVSLSGNKNTVESSYDVTEEMVSDTVCALSEEEYEPIDGLTIGNPWRKDYFHSDWGEINENSPMIYTTLDGTGWNIHIDYLPPTADNQTGIFRFYLVDDDGRLTESYGPVNILIRGADGEVEIVEVTGTKEGVTFVEDPSTVLALIYYLDHETFDIRMEFEKYNERHATQAHWESTPGFFQEALDKLL